MKKFLLPILSLFVLASCSNQELSGEWDVVDFTFDGDLNPEMVAGAKAEAIQYSYQFNEDQTMMMVFPSNLAQYGEDLSEMSDGRVGVSGIWKVDGEELLLMGETYEDTAIFMMNWINSGELQISQELDLLGTQTFTLSRQ